MNGRFRTKYGHFTDDGTEYVITRPDTPRPWVNVICPGEYGAIVSQAGSGYSWCTHATFNRLTRWDQDLVRDDWGKYLYCRDRDTGRYWSLTFQPVRTAAKDWECRHGVGYSIFRGETDGIASELALFVPPGETLELWRVTLTNRSRRARTLDLFSYLEWNLGPAPDTHREFHRLFIETEYAPAAGALLATKRLNTIAEHGVGQPWNVEWPHVAFHAASPAPAAHDSDKEAFIGRNRSLRDPAAVEAGRLGGTTGKWQDGCASLMVPVKLAPGESKRVTFTLGQADTRAAALALARRYRDDAAVDRAWHKMRAWWRERLAALDVATPDPAFDVLVNTWLKYQTLSCRLWGRTAYFQMGGAYGFRDQLQDSQIGLALDPAITRRQILLHAAHQFVDGTAYHWWHPLTEEGARKKLNDDLLWLPFVTVAYLRETADWSLLDERVPYLEQDGTRSRDVGTVYDHCRRAIDSFWTRIGPHGVPRMGAGDWNDGLSAIGNDLKSESVWLGHFLVGILDDWCELERHRQTPDTRVIAKYAAAAKQMRADVNRHFWDGAWYQRATKDSGEVIGSRRCRDGKIFLNAQTWAILNGVVPKRRLPKLLRSLERHLYRDYGPLLLAPAYRVADAEIGYLTRYSPGSRENGGLYTHAGLWAIQAECLIGRRAQAWKLWRSFCPVLRGADPDHYAVEPYVMPGNVDGPDSPHYGRGGWTWYTGSSAWTFRIATEWILGVRPEWDGLRVQPCLPPGWRGFTMTRRFRGALYTIRVVAGRARERVTVDGVEQRGTLVPAFADGAAHEVVVELTEPVTPARRARPAAHTNGHGTATAATRAAIARVAKREAAAARPKRASRKAAQAERPATPRRAAARPTRVARPAARRRAAARSRG